MTCSYEQKATSDPCGPCDRSWSELVRAGLCDPSQATRSSSISQPQQPTGGARVHGVSVYGARRCARGRAVVRAPLCALQTQCVLSAFPLFSNVDVMCKDVACHSLQQRKWREWWALSEWQKQSLSSAQKSILTWCQIWSSIYLYIYIRPIYIYIYIYTVYIYHL